MNQKRKVSEGGVESLDVNRNVHVYNYIKISYWPSQNCIILSVSDFRFFIQYHYLGDRLHITPRKIAGSKPLPYSVSKHRDTIYVRVRFYKPLGC